MKIVIKGYLLLACLMLPCYVFAATIPPAKPTGHHAKKPVSSHHSKKHAKKVHVDQWVEPVAPVYNTYGFPPAALLYPNHFEVIGAGGIASINQGNAYLGVTSSETDKLIQTNDNRWNTGVGQLGVGFVYYLPNRQRFSCCTQWFPSIEPELNYYYSPNNYIKGNVLRFGDPGLNEFNYKVTVRTSRLMLDAALTVVSYAEYSLFVIGGVGEAWSSVKYSDSGNAKNPCILSAVTLSNRSQSNFAWDAGIGVAYLLNNAINYRANLSLEYLYTDFGSLKLPGKVGGTRLTAPQIEPSTFNLHTQAIFLGLHVALS